MLIPTTVLQTTPSPVFFCKYMRKHFFIASFHASMRSQMFFRIDVLEISSKFTGKHACTRLLTPGTGVFQRILNFFSKHLFYRTSLNDCFWFPFNLLTVLRRFSFWTDQYLFKIRAILGYIKIHRLWPTGPPYILYLE